MFKKQAGVERFGLIQTFHACKQEEEKPFGPYVIKIKNYVAQLERLGYVFPQDLSVGLILNGLTSDFARFVRNYNMHNMGKTIGELHALLIEYEIGLPKKAATPQVMEIQGGRIQKANKKSLNTKGNGKGKGIGKDKSYILKPKNPKPSAKEHPAKDDTCHHCKEVGHWKRSCPSYLTELIKKKKKRVGTVSSSDIFTIELFSFPNKSWVYDTGRGTQIYNTKQGLIGERKLKQGALYLFMGNGVHAHVEAIGNRGGEYISQEFKDYPKGYGIVQRLTPPYTPQHNEVSERRNHTLLDMVRSMMNLTTLSLSFWDYALETATRILNMVPTKKVDKTPYELRYGKVPNLSYLKVWGCEALVKRDTPDKLQQRAFLEKNLISQEISKRAEELEEIQNEDTSPSENTSKIPIEVEGFKPPQEEVIPIRRSARTHRAPDRLCINLEVKEHSLGDLNEPANYKAAILDPESDKWLDAMNAENP
ncbi:retrotransposon protein, putative, ty1-copia subclass [Tanacetum coccineum]